MKPIRHRATTEADAELQVRGLPIRRGEESGVVVLIEDAGDEAVLVVLEHDPGWAWLHDPEDDIYSAPDDRQCR